MFCKNCGKEVKEDWKICPNCGTPIVAEEVAESKDEQKSGKRKLLGNKKEKVKRPFYKKKRFWFILIVIIFFIFAVNIDLEKLGIDTEETKGHDSDSDTAELTEEQLFGYRSSSDALYIYDDDGNKVFIEYDGEGNAIINENGDYIARGSRFICKLGAYQCTDGDFTNAYIGVYYKAEDDLRFVLFDTLDDETALQTGEAHIVDHDIISIDLGDYQVTMDWQDESTVTVTNNGERLGGPNAVEVKDMTTDRHYEWVGDINFRDGYMYVDK